MTATPGGRRAGGQRPVTHRTRTYAGAAVSASSTLRVVGVYLPRETPELVEQAVHRRLLELGTTTSKRRREVEAACRDALASVALIEVSVQDADVRFTVDDFVQPDPTKARSNWQVAWNEVFLSTDGESRVECAPPSTPAVRAYRVAFYLHDWRAELGLASSYGPLECPAPCAVPARLWTAAPYAAVE